MSTTVFEIHCGTALVETRRGSHRRLSTYYDVQVGDEIIIHTHRQLEAERAICKHHPKAKTREAREALRTALNSMGRHTWYATYEVED